MATQRKQLPSKQLITPEFLAFGVQLAEPHQPPFANAAPKFGLSITLAPSDAQELMKAIQAVALEAWPGLDEKLRLTLENGDIKTIGLPFQTGETVNQKRVIQNKAPYDFLPGKLVFRSGASADRQPEVIDAKGKPLEAKTIRGGDKVRAAIAVAAVETPTWTGVTIYLNAVMLIEKGRSSHSATDLFKDHLAGQSDVNPFADFVVD